MLRKSLFCTIISSMKSINKKLLEIAEDGNLEELKRIEKFKHIDWTSLREDNTSLLTIFVELEHDSLYYVKKCLDAGIDVNHQNKQGTTALHIAAISNNVQVVDFLISKGAKFDIESEASLISLKQILNGKNELIIHKILGIVYDYSCLIKNLEKYDYYPCDLDYLNEINEKSVFMKKIDYNLPEKVKIGRKNKI